MSQTLSGWLGQVAKCPSAYGGGSTAAAAAAMAAALLEKLSGTAALRARFRKKRKVLERLIEKDARVFEVILKTSRSKQPQRFRNALVRATDVQWDVHESAWILLQDAEQMRPKVKASYASDWVCAQSLLRSALKASKALIRANAQWLGEADYKAECARRLGGYAKRHAKK